MTCAGSGGAAGPAGNTRCAHRARTRGSAGAAAAGGGAQLHREPAHGHGAARAHHAPWSAHPVAGFRGLLGFSPTAAAASALNWCHSHGPRATGCPLKSLSLNRVPPGFSPPAATARTWCGAAVKPGGTRLAGPGQVAPAATTLSLVGMAVQCADPYPARTRVSCYHTRSSPGDMADIMLRGGSQIDTKAIAVLACNDCVVW